MRVNRDKEAQLRSRQWQKWGCSALGDAVGACEFLNI